MADFSQQNVNELNSGFDSLRESIKGLNKELPEFADGMQAGLKAMAKELPNVAEQMIKINAENKKLVAEGGKPKSILTQLASSMLSLNGALSIGATLLVTYGGEIIKWATNLIKGETKLSTFSKALKDSQIVSEALIQTQVKSQKSAQSEIISLNALYRASQNHNLSLQERQKATDMLKAQWPNTFKNISNETIMAGKAAFAYKALKEEILATAYAEAAKNKITENAGRSIDNELKIVKERNVNDQLKASLQKLKDDTQNHYKEDRFNTDDAGTGALIASGIQANKLEEEIRSSNKIISDLKTDSKLLDMQNKALADKVSKLTEKKGVGILSSNKPPSYGTLKNKNIAIKMKPSPVPEKPTGRDEGQTLQESRDRTALPTLQDYTRDIEEANQHFVQLKKQHKGNKATLEQLEREHQATLAFITKKFQAEGLAKLSAYGDELNKASKTAREQALDQLNADYQKKGNDVKKIRDDNQKIVDAIEGQLLELNTQKLDTSDRMVLKEIDKKQAEVIDAKITELKKKYDEAKKIVDQAKLIDDQLSSKHDKDSGKLTKGFEDQDKKGSLEESVIKNERMGKWKQEFAARQALLDLEKQQAIDAAKVKGDSIYNIESIYKRKQDDLDKARLDAQAANQKRYVKALDSLATAVSAIFGKNTVAARLAFKAHQAASAAEVIINTRSSIMKIWSANSGLPFIGVPKAIAETAIVAATGASNLAAIIKQKPGFAQGGQYTSDGRGALLPGYSRYDNTNARLRSGEAVVVSEAMRNPWARNLVSAINVAHGGRDFSIPNPGRGYAIGGIFTDGGNASRYYSQPMNDNKELANTLAYQMLNNFPPIYVDVKDVNTQQSILAQTVNRVNL